MWCGWLGSLALAPVRPDSLRKTMYMLGLQGGGWYAIGQGRV